MNADKMNGKMTARVRMQKYRATHRRIDYAPSKAALVEIERHKGIDNCLAGVLDQLILAGSKAMKDFKVC